MPLFSKSPPAVPGATAADLQAVGVRLDAVATALEAHYVITAAQGEALAAMPAAMLDHLRSEVRAMAGEMAKMAWVASKQKLLEHGSSWAIKAIYGSLAVYALSWAHTAMGWFQGHGK